ncbi:hypothetical protein [Micromonospora polyrhachis]|uniref:Uncharacterized protein n=1 Tax=Micromonospora polyrhachis TaxID=1282883 RepID=A0A7W7SSC3_9ACTN|nr:hypothetical protein [Micromonospora polyrhachis]MBB4960082.1 hypothetical protein [Micromonospora polyrhachis]
MASTTPPPPESGPRSGPSWSAGMVTRLGTPSVTARSDAASPASEPRNRQRRRLWWFGGAALAVLAAGLAVVLAMVLSGDPRILGDDYEAPPDTRPQLARMCPPPASPPARTDQPPVDPGPPPSGARTVDQEAGISYAALGAPWQPWDVLWNAGALEVPYKVGQHFVTEPQYNGFSDYHASILSAAVPAADNDALILDIECVGRRVADDVRAEYYPQPNRMEPIRDERATIGGRPAWVAVFRLHFSRPGLRATDELAAVACIDVGRPTAAILYISIPGTHRQYDPVVDQVLNSVRVR